MLHPGDQSQCPVCDPRINYRIAIILQLKLCSTITQHYEHTRSASAINSATLKHESWDDFHTEAMTCPPQINTYVVAGKSRTERMTKVAP